MEAKDFINKEYFNLTLDCNSEVLAQIYSALEEYAKTEQLRIGGVGSITELELKNILIDFGGIVKKSLNKEVVDIAESFVVYNRIKD